MKLLKFGIPFFVVLVLGACSMAPFNSSFEMHDRLPECGSKPNCVSSQDPRPRFYIAPVTLNDGVTMDDVAAALAVQPRTTIVTQTDTQLHAENRSKWFKFVDDIQLALTNNVLYFYSASRVGYSDLGVNRKRIEALITQLNENGWIAPDSEQVTTYP
uniref:DUF1499 domain-containing protein n=1 Tax=Thaumasiovibrio occultus TaxID=1891184 RepID=UPI000B363D5B|nr:DUF1499 domain-containing protein [Thaumasiovibrio occultus]